MPADLLELTFKQGEDVTWQLFWTDEYDEPIPVTEPVLMDVKDVNGQIVARFSTNNDPVTQAAIAVSGGVGYFQLTMPKELSRKFPPGGFYWDLFACVADSAEPFPAQAAAVTGGIMTCERRVTQVEGDSLAVLSENPLGG
jgi:hypothetical protein